MKRIWISIIIISLCFLSAQAQLINGLGCKMGAAFAKQDFDYDHDYNRDLKTRIGFDVAIYAEWLNLPFLHVLTEVHYIQKGMIEDVERWDINNISLSNTENNRIDYLSIPILAKVMVTCKNASQYILIGPRFDFLLGYKTGFFSSSVREIYSDFKNNSISGDIGYGMEINWAELIKTSIEFRYSPDFGYAYKSEHLKVKNESFEILVGCLIPLSIK